MDSPPDSLSEAVSRETEGSKILWSATPEPAGYARQRWKGALMGIPFTAFSIFWTWGASGGLSNNHEKGAPVFFVLWGWMFIGFGLCILLSPVFALWKAGRVFYAVTDKGALIFEKVWSLKIHSFDASGFNGFERVSRGDRQGDILFQRKIESSGKGAKATNIGFIGLRDYKEAEVALRNMMKMNERSNRSAAAI